MKIDAWNQFKVTGQVDDYLKYKQQESGELSGLDKKQNMENDERETDTYRDGSAGSTSGGLR